MQHQQAERRSLLHVGAEHIKLKGGTGDDGHKDPRKKPVLLWPDHWESATAERCWVSNSGQLRNLGDLRTLGGGNGGVSPPSPS